VRRSAGEVSRFRDWHRAWASGAPASCWASSGAAWHLPLFFIPGTQTSGQSFGVSLVSVTAISVAMAWLYAHTNGSLLLVMLMHAAINNTKDIVPSAAPDGAISLVARLTTVLLWVAAAYFLARMPGRALPRSSA
jgi:membrane protease YdiL (CAAX protease family)